MSTSRHYVITRFSYRGKHVLDAIGGPTFVLNTDPLEPNRLAQRFAVFEFTCLPSILGQSNQDFTWVLLVDRELPPVFHRRLESLVGVRPNTRIIAYDPRMNLAQLDWLGEDAAQPGFVITTNLDDDDCIPPYFVERLQQHVRAASAAAALPPVTLLGIKAALEWDLVAGEGAPLGWRAPWHRGVWVVSVGLSLGCLAPAFKYCVIGLRHREAERYLDFTQPAPNANALWFQQSVLAAARAGGVALERWPRARLFSDLSTTCGPALLTNHATNDQATRLHEAKAARVAVEGPTSLTEFSIDWPKAHEFLAAQARA